MTNIISWDNVMGKKVRSIGGEDIGKVENVNTYFIEVKDGLLAKSTKHHGGYCNYSDYKSNVCR